MNRETLTLRAGHTAQKPITISQAAQARSPECSLIEGREIELTPQRAVASTDALDQFLLAHRCDERAQIAADDRWIEIHTRTRGLVLSIDQAANSKELKKHLRTVTSLKTWVTTFLVLDALIFYSTSQKSARSRDRAVQAQMEDDRVKVTGVRAYMEKHRGVSGVYDLRRAKKRPVPLVPRQTIKEQVKTVCDSGSVVLGILKIDASGKLVLWKNCPVPNTDGLEAVWSSIVAKVAGGNDDGEEQEPAGGESRLPGRAVRNSAQA